MYCSIAMLSPSICGATQDDSLPVASASTIIQRNACPPGRPSIAGLILDSISLLVSA
nr:hypothetical protein CPGR_02398 [Mycolicibacter nonchromogenicus]